MGPARVFVRADLAVLDVGRLAVVTAIPPVRTVARQDARSPAAVVPVLARGAAQEAAEIHVEGAVRDVHPAAALAAAVAVVRGVLADVQAPVRAVARAVAEAVAPDVPAPAVEAAPAVQGLVQVAVMDVLVLVQKDAQGIAMGLV